MIWPLLVYFLSELSFLRIAASAYLLYRPLDYKLSTLSEDDCGYYKAHADETTIRESQATSQNKSFRSYLNNSIKVKNPKNILVI